MIWIFISLGVVLIIIFGDLQVAIGIVEDLNLNMRIWSDWEEESTIDMKDFKNMSHAERKEALLDYGKKLDETVGAKYRVVKG